MSLHLYRVTINSYPTPDGKPFAEQSVEFWQKCLDAHYDPSAGELPAFMDWDFEEWIYQEDPPQYPYYEGGNSYGGRGGFHVMTDPPMVVPVTRRRHWLSPSAARAESARLREWGCEVTVEKSKPIEFEDTK
ncbi:hypothetical protein [Glutamicibacter ardleyensis]|uniref:Uncharacterized protein n=1 Tax=Glutamicibacter ardleyensis TaxID=225894 RepID=A0ABQ2DFA7_9MICC|nr:hypothetical protein [Glutamicibacter ardleyensis]GGJ56062.1 hypothetical protein GCM10007173_13600 [Glutamicibacter ardleyensis]